jgi:hypothetical protein
MLAVVGPDAAVFAQLGDGAIVYHDGNRYAPVFWPQSGEYHNATHFLTDASYTQHLQVGRFAATVSEVAMFTDGLQMLALNYADRSAHQPFFTPMFRALRSTGNHADLSPALRGFLESKDINERTDDDKTLVLASRLSHAADPD